MLLPAVICALPIITALLCRAVSLRPEDETAEMAWPTAAAGATTVRPWEADELLASSLCVVLDVFVTEIVAVDNDLLVAFAGGPGSWYLPGDARADAVGLVRGVDWVEATVPLHVPSPVARRQALDTLSSWRATAVELQAFISVELRLTGLVNPATGEVFAAPLDSSVTGRV